MALAHVQSVVDARVGGADSSSLSITPTAGNLLVLGSAIFYSAGTGGVRTVSGGGTWSSAGEFNGDATSWVCLDYTASATGGASTVTCNPNGATADIDLSCAEFSGHAASPLDKSNVTNSAVASSTPNVASGVLAQANEVIVAMCSHTGGNTSIAPDATYTQIGENENNSTGQTYNMQFKIVASTSSDTADWTLGAARDWFALLASFQESAGGGATPSPRPWRMGLLGVG
jgi:hypothetical protein